MYLKIHNTKNGIMVAVADDDLIGKKLRFGKVEFFVNPRFYKGGKVRKEEAIKIMRAATSVNFVGRESVECGKEAGMIDEQNIIMINKKVPHAQAIVIPERA